MPVGKRANAIADANHIPITHGDFDHTSEVDDIARDIGATVADISEIFAVFQGLGYTVIEFNKGGTIHTGEVAVSVVTASHSSSMVTKDGVIYAGTESGYMIRGEGKTIYFSGDTDIMADMDWMGDYYKPDIDILSAGGHCMI